MNDYSRPGSIPVFAIIGHPNEGKSSVLSTLAEDDSVRVSPVPGETVACQTFPVRIDGREVIRFIDTPGFQNPRATLEWMHRYEGPPERLVAAFRRAHIDDPGFHDDCELLGPVEAGAGVIFVVDGSRPLRQVDLAEMEVLRLTGAARMAVINSKEEDTAYLRDWQNEFRKHFNSVRLFNSNRATYAQRIELLDSLKSIDQNLEPVLRRVVEAFQADWGQRNSRSASILVDFFREILVYRKSVPCKQGAEEQQRLRMQEHFQDYVAQEEHKAHTAIRRLFKHNIFNLELPPQSILAEDVFSERTWEFLGLSRGQLIVAGAVGGAALGLGLDAATLGHSLGIASVIGGIIGAGATALKGEDFFSGARLLGMQVGGEQLQVGPVSNVQLLFILIDRALLFYAHVINWAHGRRDYKAAGWQAVRQGGKGGYATSWSAEERRICEHFFVSVRGGREDVEERCAALHQLLLKQFARIAGAPFC